MCETSVASASRSPTCLRRCQGVRGGRGDGVKLPRHRRDDGVKKDAGKAQPVRRVPLGELVERVQHELGSRRRTCASMAFSGARLKRTRRARSRKG